MSREIFSAFMTISSYQPACLFGFFFGPLFVSLILDFRGSRLWPLGLSGWLYDHALLFETGIFCLEGLSMVDPSEPPLESTIKVDHVSQCKGATDRMRCSNVNFGFIPLLYPSLSFDFCLRHQLSLLSSPASLSFIFLNVIHTLLIYETESGNLKFKTRLTNWRRGEAKIGCTD